MKPGRLLGATARSVGRHRLRTFFMTLGTLIGVAALTIVFAYGRGTQDAVLDNFNRMFSGSSILLSAGGGGTRGGPHADGPTATLTLEDLEAIAAGVPAIVAYDPAFSIAGRDVVVDGVSESIMIMGHSETHEAVWSRGVASGAYFGAEDVRASARVAVVGRRVVQDLFDGRNPIGEIVRIENAPFEVIGVLEPGGIDPHGVDKDFEIHVPITTAQRRLLNVDFITTARFLVDPSANLDDVLLDIEEILRPRHALSPADPNDFRMFTPIQVQTLIRSGNRVFTVLLPLIAAISLIVGAIVVANLMLMSVSERRSEIGLRKAVGAKRRDITAQFLLESLAVTCLGGLLALAIGWLVLGHMGATGIAVHGADFEGEAAARVSLGLPWHVALLGLGASILVGLVAGVVPARRAAELDPVDTLR